MLAPLKNRQRLERDSADPQADLSLPAEEDSVSRIARLEAEVAALSGALRQSRQAQLRNATESASKIIAQLNEINRLNELVATQRQRLNDMDSGRAVIELGQHLQQAHAASGDGEEAERRVWFLDKTIRAAHAECERLARERDALAVNFQCPLIAPFMPLA